MCLEVSCNLSVKAPHCRVSQHGHEHAARPMLGDALLGNLPVYCWVHQLCRAICSQSIFAFLLHLIVTYFDVNDFCVYIDLIINLHVYEYTFEHDDRVIESWHESFTCEGCHLIGKGIQDCLMALSHAGAQKWLKKKDVTVVQFVCSELLGWTLLHFVEVEADVGARGSMMFAGCHHSRTQLKACRWCVYVHHMPMFYLAKDQTGFPTPS